MVGAKIPVGVVVPGGAVVAVVGGGSVVCTGSGAVWTGAGVVEVGTGRGWVGSAVGAGRVVGAGWNGVVGTTTTLRWWCLRWRGGVNVSGGATGTVAASDGSRCFLCVFDGEGEVTGWAGTLTGVVNALTSVTPPQTRPARTRVATKLCVNHRAFSRRRRPRSGFGSSGRTKVSVSLTGHLLDSDRH